MATNIDIFSWHSLTAAVNKVAPARTFLLDTFFKTKVQHSVRDIYYGKSEESDKLALFVNAHENPKLVAQMQKGAKHFQLPITREKKVWTAEELAKQGKQVGEVFVGSPADIANASNTYVLQEVQSLKNRVIRLREWMAAQALDTGKITVSQDNIDFELDYEYLDQRNSFTLTGTSLWSNAGSKPLEKIREYKRLLAQRGYTASHLILGYSAANAFIAHADVKAYQLRPDFVIGSVNLTNKYTDYGNFLGNFMGVDVWEYPYQYTNAAGAKTDMITSTSAIMVGQPTDMTPASDPFRLHYGPVFRVDAGNRPLTITNEMLLEPHTNEYRTFLEWILEQCSLPVIHDRDAVIKAKVA